MSDNFYCLLYCSHLAPTAPFNAVPDIIRKARSFNSVNDITGVLIFDGRNFMQYLEGKQNTVMELMGRISQDNRHINFQLQYNGEGFGNRRFRGWSIAYAYLEDDVPLRVNSRLNGREAMMHFSALLPELELA